MVYEPMTDEEKADMTPAEIEQQIADLQAQLADLQRPVPQPYPKWVTIGGVPQVVQTEADEQRLTKADADAKAKMDDEK